MLCETRGRNFTFALTKSSCESQRVLSHVRACVCVCVSQYDVKPVAVSRSEKNDCQAQVEADLSE